MHELIDELEQSFYQSSCSETRVKQIAYLRHQFDFFGLDTQTRRQIQKQIFKKYSIHKEEDLQHLVKLLWTKEKRELQYAAIDLIKKEIKKITPNFIQSLEYMLNNKAWWETVDEIGVHLIGFLVLKHPALMHTMDQWILHENMWMKRVALICQNNWKEKTDHIRLFKYCLVALNDKQFFIRKAIGWALRQYSKIQPERVQNFILTNQQCFSGLSLRESCKHLKREVIKK